MSDPLIVEVERCGFVESTHLVDVAVVGDDGRLVAWAGDPMRPAAFRSSAKPIQARVSLECGWSPGDDRMLAIACASHNGEAEHVAVVRALLREAGVPEDALACPADVPAFADAALAVHERRPIYHNCSGKHAGMLAACRAAGWPLEGYRAPEHPLQRRVLDRIDRLAGGTLAVLVDGCGVPTPVAPLASWARAFHAIEGGAEAAAMRAHPFFIGGTGRLDTDLMTHAPQVLIKSGAEGLACLSVERMGIALKARDGGPARFRGPAVISMLRQLGAVGEAQVAALAFHAEVPVLGGGRPVGMARARGLLSRRGDP